MGKGHLLVSLTLQLSIGNCTLPTCVGAHLAPTRPRSLLDQTGTGMSASPAEVSHCETTLTADKCILKDGATPRFSGLGVGQQLLVF